jgi:hypothetical protein
MMAPKTFKELRAMPEAELVRLYDSLAGRTQVGTEFYLGELNRRVTDRQTKTITRLTWAIAALTLALVILTIVLVLNRLSAGSRSP